MDSQKQLTLFPYLDSLLPVIPSHGLFSIEGVIPNNFDKPNEPIYKLIGTFESDTAKLLTDFGYTTRITTEQFPHYSLELTDKGRELKKAGGHFIYLKQLADKEQKEKDRQHKTDEISKYDLLQKKYFYKSRYAPHIFSGLAFIGTVFSIFISYKALHKSDQTLTPKTTDTTQNKPKNEILLRVDTTLKTKDTLRNQ